VSARLQTRDGGFVVAVDVPLTDWPEIIIWGERFFRYGYATPTNAIYVETFTWFAPRSTEVLAAPEEP
jgi:hypothetical protein